MIIRKYNDDIFHFSYSRDCWFFKLCSCKVSSFIRARISCIDQIRYAVKGLADTLLTELKPHNIRISVAYPPDTDTPGYAKEMETKPPDTKEVSNDQPTKSLLLILEDISNEFDF